jgi:hypothetical protein
MDPLNMTDADVITTLEKLRKSDEAKLSAAVEKRSKLRQRDADAWARRISETGGITTFLDRVILELSEAIKQGTAEIEACSVRLAAIDKAIDAVKQRPALVPSALSFPETCDRECSRRLTKNSNGLHLSSIIHSIFCPSRVPGRASAQSRPAPTGDPGGGRPVSAPTCGYEFNAAQAVSAQRDETPQINPYVRTTNDDPRRRRVIATLNNTLSFFLSHPQLGYQSAERDLREALAFVVEGA